jgi:hypothetical protein
MVRNVVESDKATRMTHHHVPSKCEQYILRTAETVETRMRNSSFPMCHFGPPLVHCVQHFHQDLHHHETSHLISTHPIASIALDKNPLRSANPTVNIGSLPHAALASAE